MVSVIVKIPGRNVFSLPCIGVAPCSHMYIGCGPQNWRCDTSGSLLVNASIGTNPLSIAIGDLFATCTMHATASAHIDPPRPELWSRHLVLFKMFDCWVPSAVTSCKMPLKAR